MTAPMPLRGLRTPATCRHFNNRWHEPSTDPGVPRMAQARERRSAMKKVFQFLEVLIQVLRSLGWLDDESQPDPGDSGPQAAAT